MQKAFIPSFLYSDNHCKGVAWRHMHVSFSPYIACICNFVIKTPTHVLTGDSP